MTDEIAETDAKGRFLPGNKIARRGGRPKGALNKFGPTFRAKLLAGIERAGIKRARKNGVNHKVDGTEYLVQHLVETSSAAAATLIAKLIPPPEADLQSVGGGVTVNVIQCPSGHAVCPDKKLRPNEEAKLLWDAERKARGYELIETDVVDDNLMISSPNVAPLRLVDDTDNDDDAA